MADNIRQFIQSKNIELISFRPIMAFDERASDEIDSLDQINIFELFEQYYKIRFPENEEIPENIKESFRDLVEQSRGSE